MATKSISHWLSPKRACKGVTVAILFFLLGCQTTQNSKNGTAPTHPSSRERNEAPPHSGGEKSETSPSPGEALKIGVVLSPGGARAFAHLGVIKEMLKARIPVSAVVGVEWGSLVGALYTQNGQIHEAEWKLYKLETKEFSSRSFFGPSRPQSIQSFNGFLSENLKGRNLTQASLRFACPTLSVWAGSFQWQERGEFADALKKCMPSPPLLKGSGPWASALISGRDAAQWLRKQGYNVVILVDVLRSPDFFEQERMLEDMTLSTLYLEMRRSFTLDRAAFDEVIGIDTKGFKVSDFEKRRDLVSLGERLGRSQAEAIAKKYGF